MFKKFTLICLFLLAGKLLFAQNFPPRSNTLVTDSVDALSPGQRDQLERKLVAFDDSTSTQIAVVILKTVGNYDINQYGAGLIRAWGIGQKVKNNGILILVAMGDRKVSIQTGYGAEGAVPDIVTHDIIENDIKPAFKQGLYYQGLDAATNSLMKLMKGEYTADQKRVVVHTDNNGGSDGGSIGVVIFIIIVILIVIFRNIGGGGGHIIGRRGGASPFWWFLMGTALGRGSDNDGGGFFGGGGSSGGGSGGFGGFGGGDSGGGGSSGSW